MLATPISLAQRATDFLERSSKRQKRETREKEIRLEDDAYKARAREYIDSFLDTSEWSDRREHITVLWDAIPTIQELRSFGVLDQTEGTQACRRLFKAVVVWDELGLSLWKRLKAASDVRLRDEEDIIAFLAKANSSTVPGTPLRRASTDTTTSRKSPWSIRSLSLSSENLRSLRRKRLSRTPSPDKKRSPERGHPDPYPCYEVGHPGTRLRTGSIPWF